MAKRKTLTKDFEEIVKSGDMNAFKKVFDKCDINAYGGYNKGNAFLFPLTREMMKWLVAQGADIDYVDAYGYTPLLLHAGRSYEVKQALDLINLGANVHAVHNPYKENALHYAIPTGNIELVQRLLEAGTDIHAVDWNGNTPLERAFRIARGFELIQLEPVTRFLLEQGIVVTDKMQQYMLDVAKDIEFRRSSINKDHIAELDAALDSLYDLLNVPPVPRRVEYDGKSRIEVSETTWQKQHSELWELLVPGSGHANTIQGEVIRISGKLGYEILDNGCMNWDNDFKALAQAFLTYVQMGNPLSEAELAEVSAIVRSIKNAFEKEMGRLSELAVKWVILNPEPIAAENIAYRR